MSRMKKEERNENAEKKRGVSRFTPYALIGPAMALMASLYSIHWRIWYI